jgi:hypothetical protein
MCKDERNGLNFDYKKVADYHIGIAHHIQFWDLTIKECNYHHFPKRFNWEFYEVIQAFQGKRVINALGYIRDVRAKGDVIYIPPNAGLDIDQVFVAL